MANITKTNTNIIFSPENNAIPITFQDSLNNNLLTLSSSTYLINTPIIKQNYDTSFNQLGGGGVIYSTGTLLYSTPITQADCALILPKGVWYIQGSFRLTYSNQSGNTIPMWVITQCFTSKINLSYKVSDLFYGPGYFVSTFDYGGAYVANTVPLFNYTFTQIFHISCVVPLSLTTTVYVSGLYGGSVSDTIIGFNGLRCSAVANAFRIG